MNSQCLLAIESSRNPGGILSDRERPPSPISIANGKIQSLDRMRVRTGLRWGGRVALVL